MTTTTVTKTTGEFKIVEHAGHVEIDFTPSVRPCTFVTFQIVDTVEQAHQWIEHTEKVNRMMQIMDRFTTEMEGYSYFGSNPGIPEDVYDEVAEEIIKEFGV